MEGESPMMAAAATADPSSPITHKSGGAGLQTVLATLVRSPLSLHQDRSTVHSKGTTDPTISTHGAASMADAFRKALRRPDFVDPQPEDGEAPDSNAVHTEERLLRSELDGEGREIMGVDSERGVTVVTDGEADKSQ